MTSTERESWQERVADAGQSAAQIWPLKTFAYRNPLRGWEHLPFDEAIRTGRRVIGGTGYLASEDYREFLRKGRITQEALASAVREIGPRCEPDSVRAGDRTIQPAEVLQAHLAHGIDALDSVLLDWKVRNGGRAEIYRSAAEACASLDGSGPGSESVADLPAERTLSDWLDELTGSSIVESVDQQMAKWAAAFLDDGMAGWGMPSRSVGFYRCWRALAARDLAGRFLGISDCARKVAALPESAEEAIALAFERLAVPAERIDGYISRLSAQLPGWTGFVRWRSENPQYPGQADHPADLVDYLAVRLFYETELVEATCRERLGIPGTLEAIRACARERAREERSRSVTAPAAGRLYQLATHLDLTPEQVRGLGAEGVRTLLGWLDAFPEDRHGPVWLTAFEDSYRERLVAKLAGGAPASTSTGERPKAQLIFCIDARSEPFRRQIESQGPYETFGYAGFFGVPISHQAFDSDDRLALCPVLLKPARSADESVRDGGGDALQRYASGTRWLRLGDGLFHDLKQHPLSGYLLVDMLGFLYSVGLAGKTFLHRRFAQLLDWGHRRFWSAVPTRVALEEGPGKDGVPAGFTLAERAAFVGNGLRMIGLTNHVAPLVVVCGHGAVSENNPYAAAYNCGACGGAHGDPNARAFAAMGNDPAVREALAADGFAIPDDVRFIAAKHDTTTDCVSFYDVDDLSDGHAEALRALQSELVDAGSRSAAKRIGRLPGAPRQAAPARAARHAVGRSVDWANPRPEWGLSSNAAFIVGRRSFTKGLDLESRVFLHSYDPVADTDGSILEKIMTAPLIVGEWINMEYYFSAVDPWVYGSGSKVLHNVVGGIGVMLGSHGDLQGGLPVQGVADGPRRYHEPMRLQAIIEAPAERISGIIGKHGVLQDLFGNRWVNLLAVDPQTKRFHRYDPAGEWQPLAVSRAA